MGNSGCSACECQQSNAGPCITPNEATPLLSDGKRADIDAAVDDTGELLPNNPNPRSPKPPELVDSDQERAYFLALNERAGKLDYAAMTAKVRTMSKQEAEQAAAVARGVHRDRK